MNATHKPGTVALVTVTGKHSSFTGMRGCGVHAGQGHWTVFLDDIDGMAFGEDFLTDITPLVCVEATRADADLLVNASNLPGDTSADLGDSDRDRLRHIAAAIREQTPEPEPPKRWTVRSYIGDGDDDPTFWLYDEWRCTNARGTSRGEMQAIADALNAATTEPSR